MKGLIKGSNDKDKDEIDNDGYFKLPFMPSGGIFQERYIEILICGYCAALLIFYWEEGLSFIIILLHLLYG